MRKHTRRIFWLQCIMVGARNVDPHKERWFTDYQWTRKRERVFIWIVTVYLKLLRGARCELTGSSFSYKGKCRKVAQEWAWTYGWKIKKLDS